MEKIKLYFKILFWSLVVSFIIVSCAAFFISVTNIGEVKTIGFIIAIISTSLGISIPAYLDELKELKDKL